MTSATIKLFLPHGDAKRLRVGEVSNWTGKALAAPRTELDDLLLRVAALDAESAQVLSNIKQLLNTDKSHA